MLERTAYGVIDDRRCHRQEAFFIETIFSPWTTARRLARSGSVAAARKRYPETLLSAMDAIVTLLADIERGFSEIPLELSLDIASDVTMASIALSSVSG